MDERDYELIGEDVPDSPDPAAYGVLTDADGGDDPTEFGYERGELPDAPTPEGEDEDRPLGPAEEEG